MKYSINFDFIKRAICDSKSKKWAKVIAEDVRNDQKAVYSVKYISPNQTKSKSAKVYFCYGEHESVIAIGQNKSMKVDNIVSINREHIDYDYIKFLVPFYINGKEDFVESAAKAIHGDMGRCLLDWEELKDLGLLIEKNGNWYLLQQDMYIIVFLINRRYGITYPTIVLASLINRKEYTYFNYQMFMWWLKLYKHLKVNMSEEKSLVFFAMSKRLILGH